MVIGQNRLYFRTYSALACCSIIAFATPLAAQEQPASRPMLSTQQCADQWLENSQLGLGANLHPDGRFDFVSSAEEQIQAPMNSANWVIARQDAFEKARLNAMREMVAYFKEGVRSDSTMTTMMEADAEMQAPADKAPIASSSTPSPNATSGNGTPNTAMAEPTKQDTPQQTGSASRQPSLSSSLRQQINAASEDILVGVAIARQCEGLSEADGTVTGGKYSVSLTLVWSTKLQKLAQSMFNGTEASNAEPPSEAIRENQPTIKDRFAAAAKTSPDWMAYELGVRVYTDTDGESVVVGFGAVRATSLKSADVSRADLMARNYIAEFQKTQVTGIRDEDYRTSYGEGGTSGSGRLSDGSQFNDKIELKTQKKQLTGIYPLATWRGRHPETESEMVVVARAWKRSAQAQTQKISPIRGSGANGLPEQVPSPKIMSPGASGLNMGKGDF